MENNPSMSFPDTLSRYSSHSSLYKSSRRCSSLHSSPSMLITDMNCTWVKVVFLRSSPQMKFFLRPTILGNQAAGNYIEQRKGKIVPVGFGTIHVNY